MTGHGSYGNGSSATTVVIKGNAVVSALNYNTNLTTPDVTAYTGSPITVTFQNNDVAAGKVVATGEASKLSYTSDTLELADGTDANEGKVVLVEKATTPEKINVRATKLDEVEDVAEADTNQDAVGYYVENLGITKDTGALKWQITMNDEAKYEKSVGVGLSVEDEGTMDVSFGIVLYGSIDGHGTSDISGVYVTE